MKNKNISRSISGVAAASIAMLSLVTTQVLANNQTQLSQSINNGVKAIDIVDGAGASVANPGVNFGALTFSFGTQHGTGTLGTASERIRVYNPTDANTWTASIAGTSTNATWNSGSDQYDFNDGSGYTDGADADGFGGQLTIDASTASKAGVGGCSADYVNMNNTPAGFVEGSVDSISLASGSDNAANKFCRWDITGVGLSQAIPAGQVTGSYDMNLALSIL